MGTEPGRNVHYTYEDYLEWDTDERYEIIAGIPYRLAAPSIDHARVSRSLFNQICAYFKGKECEAFSAPVDVRLKANDANSDDIVVQPDIFVVCDKSMITKNAINGAPDFIIEILSPSDMGYSKGAKRLLYLNAGTKEVWLVDIAQRQVIIDARGIPKIAGWNTPIETVTFPGLFLNFGDIGIE